MSSIQDRTSIRPMQAATKLRRIIEDPNGFVFAPGVYDGFSARTALEVGFDCLYMVSSPTTIAGKQDLGKRDLVEHKNWN
jgi:2-methylisocitrate lyase-like PEP mutase family enzyme